MNLPVQLPLGIQFQDNARFENFFVGPNEALLYALKNSAEQYLFIWGQSGCGKTHLLQALCHAYSSQNLSVTYLPLDHLALSPEAFDNLENMDLVCLDNIDFMAGNPLWEQALFNLYNRLRDASTRLVVAGQQSPTSLLLKLADLSSRLCWGPVFHIKPLTDAEKKAALQLRAKVRGLELEDNVAEYLITHNARDMQSLFELLDKLDEASLAAKRKLTIPFVKGLLY